MTKLFPPAVRSDLVNRERLSSLLEPASLTPVTLICGPAGYGKSTLAAASLVRDEPAPRVAWLSLDEGDNDPVRFWRYLITALRQTTGQVGSETLALLQSPQPAPTRVALTLLINEIAGRPDPLILVLDDYHVISARGIHEEMAFLLDHQPPKIHLVLISRTDPPLPLARLRAQGRLREIRMADLRFSVEEAAAFLQRVLALPLTVEDVRLLEARTEGWIAGLQLAALSIQGVDDPAAFIRTFSGSHRHLIDYLTEEVLARQPSAVRTFLLRTATLDRLSAPLCAAALAGETGDSGPSADPQAMLDYLDRANLFLLPLDNDRRWYRYHHLFADLLRLQARTAIEEGELRRIHHRAGSWFAEQGAWPEAIAYMLAAGDAELAGRFIGHQATAAVARGELDTLSGWLSGLPASQIEDDSHLRLAQAWVDLFRDRLVSATGWLEPILDQPAADDSIDNHLLGEALAVRATLAFVRGDFVGTKADTERALTLLPEALQPLRALLLWHLAFAQRSLGDLVTAKTLYHQVIDLSQRSGNFLINLSARRELAETLIGQGALTAARTILTRLLEEAAASGWRHLYPVAGAHIHLGEIAYEKGDLAEAVVRLEAGVTHPAAPEMGFDGYGYALLAWVFAAQGGRAAAAEAIEQAETTVRQVAHPLRRALTQAQISRFWLVQGDLDRAIRWLPMEGDIPPDPRNEVFARMQIARSYTLLVGGDGESAARLAADLLPAAEACGRPRDIVELLLLQALAGPASDQDTLITRAFSLAESAGFERTLVDAGRPLAALLARTGVHSPPGRRLLSMARPNHGPAANRLLVEPLSDRELEVLRLMAAGYSNREIAEKLVFTVATAKKHAEHIYGKLGVNSRTQALARARELDLL